jgi:hypothetical protein
VWPRVNFRKRLSLICLLSCGVFAPTAIAQVPQYNRDVRPILADKCFRCHGPDAAARQADLRLDESQSATVDRSGHRVIARGKPAISELIRRVTSKDDDLQMPPPDSGSSLRPAEIDVLRRWIKSGAEYQPHWSFIPPRRPLKPRVSDDVWPRNAIDSFVLARLDREGQPPSGPAPPTALIRRISLDLTGLPPTLEEIDAFERASSRDPDLAWQQLVDRLLASPRYGERMAQIWLDAARYADTNGYFTDNDRTMWPWRDWVIAAFNDNMPFDQFTIEQLAGDLLPGSTLDQKIATGFNRNHMVNNETGIVEEEFRVEYVVDRVDTTATVWMGLTLSCARCHDHKYDPISQKDFYRFFSFFNNVPEKGLSGSGGNSAPTLKVASKEQQSRLTRLRLARTNAEKVFASVRKELAAQQVEWEKTAIQNLPPTVAGLTSHDTLDQKTSGTSQHGAVEFVPGIVGQAAKLDGEAHLSRENVSDFERNKAFSFGAWIRAESSGCVISKSNDANNMRGFDVTLRKGKAIVNLAHRWNSNAIQVVTTSGVPSRQWKHLLVTYDGSSKAAGVRIFLDGIPQPVEIQHDSLSRSIRNGEPVRIGRRQTSASFKGLIDDVRFYDRQLTPREVQQLAASQLVRGIVARPPPDRTEEQKKKLREFFLKHHANRRFSGAAQRLKQLRSEESQLASGMPTTMVMQESQQPRPAFVLHRGQYDQNGEAVTAGVPAFLTEGHVGNQPNRLDMAKWLINPRHPLTARVTVNRLWQQLFGAGIVKTVDDFGTQGDWPSHPQLLDWLATELIASGWDVKHLLRLIVNSATYRQSSVCSPQLLLQDRDNRLLARGVRFRMDAEILRDQALAISGLLVEKTGGQSVFPYQPAGLWKDVTYDGNRSYPTGHGPMSLYRRSLYTFWKRQAPPPGMLVFDAPTRETCSVQRTRTNTPLQALVLMNDPTFVEAARKLAERMMTECSGKPSDRVEFAFRLATARRPDSDETQILLNIFAVESRNFSDDKDRALALLNFGASKREESLSPSELAAWTTVASLILCLDETITRQ